MKLYAESPARRVRQILTDLLVVAWVWVWIWLAVKLYHLVEKLAVPGQKMQSAGDGLAGNLGDAGDKVHKVPGVGGDLSTPFDKAADAARSLADAGREQQSIVHDMAWVLALLLLMVPIALVLFVWLPIRLRFITRASAASRIRAGAGGADLLALRALANQPLRRLARVHEDPVAAWRSGDQRVVTDLAALELRRLGLRPRTATAISGPAS
jgi:hypothetical protein